jgi:hypothetical protein
MIQTKFGFHWSSTFRGEDFAVHQPTWPLLLKIEHMVKLQVFGNNSKIVSNIKNLTWGKNDQHIKIYLPCNLRRTTTTDAK